MARTSICIFLSQPRSQLPNSSCDCGHGSDGSTCGPGGWRLRQYKVFRLAPYALLFASGIAQAARAGRWTESLHDTAAWSLAFNPSPAEARVQDSLSGGGKFTTTKFVAGKAKKSDFSVSGKNIPLLNATVQDSYAGLIPITGAANETRKLFFWYWPTSAPRGSNTLSIWLNGARNGGPHRQSIRLEHSLGHEQLYIEQPVGVGFTPRPADVKDEIDVAEEFYGFLQQFYAVFPELLRKQLYITGESYAGFYVPYIAHRIVHASKAEKNKLPIDLQGLLINDGVYSSFIISMYIPLARFIRANQAILGLNDTVVAAVHDTSAACGFEALMDLLAPDNYPPRAPFPQIRDEDVPQECFDGLEEGYTAAVEANPCLYINDITVKCPAPKDPITDYFSRSDVQEALHVPGFGEWTRCTGGVLRDDQGAITDTSPFSDTLFADLIRAVPRGLTLWHGLNDMNLLANGTRFTIQRLEWAGKQGFQREPTTPIIVDGKYSGIQHSERGLTYYEIANAGHLIPLTQPKVALEVFKTLIGKGRLAHTDGGR